MEPPTNAGENDPSWFLDDLQIPGLVSVRPSLSEDMRSAGVSASLGEVLRAITGFEGVEKTRSDC